MEESKKDKKKEKNRTNIRTGQQKTQKEIQENRNEHEGEWRTQKEPWRTDKRRMDDNIREPIRTGQNKRAENSKGY